MFKSIKRTAKVFLSKYFYSEAEIALMKFLDKNAEGHLRSYATSAHDELFSPSKRLIDLALEAAKYAHNEIDIRSVAQLFPEETKKPMNTWPGEHYRLLPAIIKALQPKLVIEIGTATGASCLCMKKYLPKSSKLVTFDIVAWKDYPGTGLKETDFDGQLEQIISDLTQKEQSAKYYDLFKQADFIFIDAAKDGRMEQYFCDFLDTIKFDNTPIVLFDDTKFISMIKIWRSIKHPKLDLTSFGHWSGTGLVEWRKM